MQTYDYKRELLHVLFSRIQLILGTATLLTTAAVAIYLFWPASYAAYGSILVRGTETGQAPGALDEVTSRALPTKKEDLYSEVQTLQSRELIQRSLDRMKRESGQAGELPSPLSTGSILSHLQVGVLPATNVIQLTFHSSDPQFATTFLDLLMDEYLSYRLEIRRPRGVDQFFSQQAKRFHRSMMEKEQELLRLVKSERSPDPQKELESNLLIKRDLELEFNRLRNQAIEKQADLKQLNNVLDDEQVATIVGLDGGVIHALLQRRVALLVERGELLRKYLPDSTVIAKLKRELIENQHLIADEALAYRKHLNAQRAVLQEKIDGITSRLNALDARNIELRRHLVRIQRIQRESALQEASYETFSKRLEEAHIRQAMDASHLSTFVRLLNPATPSEGPVFPRPLVIPMGLFAGLLLGAALGLVRESLDHTFKKPEDIERIIDLPVLFSFPDMGGANQASKAWLSFSLLALVVLLGAAGYVWRNPGLLMQDTPLETPPVGVRTQTPASPPKIPDIADLGDPDDCDFEGTGLFSLGAPAAGPASRGIPAPIAPVYDTPIAAPQKQAINTIAKAPALPTDLERALRKGRLLNTGAHEPWQIQVAALRSYAEALTLSQRYHAVGLPVILAKTRQSGTLWTRVRIGPFGQAEPALELMRHPKRSIPTLSLALNP